MSNMREAFNRAGYQTDKVTKKQDVQSKAKKVKIEDNYTKKAENVILNLKRALGQDYYKFTTSKIRNILTLVNEIYNDVIADHSKNLNKQMQDRIEYLKVRLIYESGREPKIVKPFVETSKLIEIIDGIGDNREDFIKFARYMEALVAYHRYYDGKEY